MAIRLNLHAALVAALVLGACGEDADPQKPEEGDDTGEESSDESTTGKRDAGDDEEDAEEDAEEDNQVDDEEDAGTGGSSSALSCDDVSYESWGQEFLEDNCTSCHMGSSAQKKIKLDDADEVIANKAKIKAQAVDSNKMPPAPAKLSADDEKKLAKFIECGAK